MGTHSVNLTNTIVKKFATEPPHKVLEQVPSVSKKTEGDKQSFSWLTQHQGTELPLGLLQWKRYFRFPDVAFKKTA